MIVFIFVLTTVFTLLVFTVFGLLLKYGRHHKSHELYAWFTSLMFMLMIFLFIHGMTNIIP